MGYAFALEVARCECTAPAIAKQVSTAQLEFFSESDAHSVGRTLRDNGDSACVLASKDAPQFDRLLVSGIDDDRAAGRAAPSAPGHEAARERRMLREVGETTVVLLLMEQRPEVRRLELASGLLTQIDGGLTHAGELGHGPALDEAR